MNMDDIFAEIDRLYTTQGYKKVEEYIIACIGEATRAGDENAIIQLLNELIGHYRETGEFDKLKVFAEKLLEILEASPLKGSMAHATSLLNVANAYRAAGLLRESNALYQQVKVYYDAHVAPDSMLYASLLNNMALLFQEMCDYESAADCLERALGISLLYPECRIEQASTYTNLATTLIKLDRYDEAEDHLNKAFERFEQDEDPDYHYSAALSAMAELCFTKKDYETSVKYYEKALQAIEKSVGRSHAYEITKQNMEAALSHINDANDEEDRTDNDRFDSKQTKVKGNSGHISGLELSRLYYEKYGKPMIHEKFADYEDRIAVGLVGQGSECFGYDDATSTDHDFGPGFCIWLTGRDYKKIGKSLQKEYDKLPEEFMGYKRLNSENAGKRVGVFKIMKFYKELTGIKGVPKSDEEWLLTEDSSFAHAVNGEVFRDGPGVFTSIRSELEKYYPDSVWRRKIARCASLMSQTGQYNYPRMLSRADAVTANICLSEFIRQTMQMMYLLNRQFAPYYKWMFKGLESLDKLKGLRSRLDILVRCDDDKKQDIIEMICTEVLHELSLMHLATDSDNYLDHHAAEIVFGIPENAGGSAGDNVSKEDLIDKIVGLEWKAFDKVENTGGRASCQDDWQTFQVMRKSQYMLWSKEMLQSFIRDFEEANGRGWNLITEKYGRMEETTAPEEYALIKDKLPGIPDDKKQIIEAIVEIQVGMMEEFAREYPKAASEARAIHTSDDTPYSTSYETYLRGEISTYSDETLSLYGRFVVDYAARGGNIAHDTIQNSALLYGYDSLDHMESKL